MLRIRTTSGVEGTEKVTNICEIGEREGSSAATVPSRSTENEEPRGVNSPNQFAFCSQAGPRKEILRIRHDS